MGTRYKFEPMLGPMEDWPEGTPEWIERLGNRLSDQIEHAKKVGIRTGISDLAPTVKKAIQAKPWETWPTGNPCKTVDHYFEMCTGFDYHQLWVLIDIYAKDHGIEPDTLSKIQALLPQLTARGLRVLRQHLDAPANPSEGTDHG